MYTVRGMILVVQMFRDEVEAFLAADQKYNQWIADKKLFFCPTDLHLPSFALTGSQEN